MAAEMDIPAWLRVNRRPRQFPRSSIGQVGVMRDGVPDSSATEISKGMVSIYKDVMGRGPTRARTTIANDMVVTVLEDSLTKGERTLTAKDQADAVRELRRRVQSAMSSEITKLVEMTLHREVICFLSDHSPDPDYAVEVLLLAPRSGDQEAVIDDASSISEPLAAIEAAGLSE
jgi:uncharacterized protein YbcI